VIADKAFRQALAISLVDVIGQTTRELQIVSPARRAGFGFGQFACGNPPQRGARRLRQTPPGAAARWYAA